MRSIPAPHQFSFEALVTEVNSVVDDLRWLHLDLRIRNQINEALLHDHGTVEAFLDEILGQLRKMLGAVEISMYQRVRGRLRTLYHTPAPDIPWEFDTAPWTMDAETLFQRSRLRNVPRTEVTHYIVEGNPVSSISAPIFIRDNIFCVFQILFQSSKYIARQRQLITSISRPLGLSIGYIINQLQLHEPVTIQNQKKTRPGEHAATRLWMSLVDAMPCMCFAFDQDGAITAWNGELEKTTSTSREDVITVESAVQILCENLSDPKSVRTRWNAVLRDPPAERCERIPLQAEDGVRTFSWWTKVIESNSDRWTVVFGWDVSDHAALELEIRRMKEHVGELVRTGIQNTRDEYAFVDSLLSDSSFIIVGIDRNRLIKFLNPASAKFLGHPTEEFLGAEFIQTFIRPEEHELVEQALIPVAGALPPMRPITSLPPYDTPTSDGCRIQWTFLQKNTGKDLQGEIICFGIVIPEGEDIGDYIPLASQLEAKLSQRYRFLMKYVPFPLLHLDENYNILNANPAFTELIGEQPSPGSPISDYGELDIHQPERDPSACTMYLLSKEGLTISYRGFLTRIRIFGKEIQEITLEK